MANNLNANPIRVDTVMSTGSGRDIPIEAQAIRVSGVTTAGLVTIVEAISGDVLFQASCPVGDFEAIFSLEPLHLPKSSDWKVTAIPTGGVVWIHH